MTLVERLREFVRRCAPGVDTVGKPETGVICAEAADEIERLQKMIDHYEQALKAAFPQGATGMAFEHWNEARKLK